MDEGECANGDGVVSGVGEDDGGTHFGECEDGGDEGDEELIGAGAGSDDVSLEFQPITAVEVGGVHEVLWDASDSGVEEENADGEEANNISKWHCGDAEVVLGVRGGGGCADGVEGEEDLEDEVGEADADNRRGERPGEEEEGEEQAADETGVAE